MNGLGRFALDLLLPLRMALVDRSAFRVLLSDLGWGAIEDLLEPADLPGFPALPGLVEDLEDLVATIESGSGDAPAVALVSALGIAESVIAVVEDLRGWTPPASLVGAVDVGGFGDDLAEHLPGLLLSRWLGSRAPAVHALALLLGVLTEDIALDGRELPRPRTRIDWDQLDALVAGDGSVIMARYDWGDGEWRHEEFIERLRRVAAGVGLRSRTEQVATTFTGPAPAPYAPGSVPSHVRQAVLPAVSGFLGSSPGAGFAELGVAAVPVPRSRGGPVDSILVTNHTVGTATAGVDVGSGWILTTSATAAVTGALQLKVSPGRPIELEATEPDLEARFALESPDREWILFGSAEGTRFAVSGIAVEAALTSNPPDVQLSLRTRSAEPSGTGIALVIDPGEADGFVSSLLGAAPLEAGFDLGVTWSLVGGLTVEGAAGLEIVIPLGVRIGPVEIYDLDLALTVGGEGGELATIRAGASLGAALGPLALSVDGLGLTASFRAGDEAMLRIGDFGIDIGLQPPKGIGVGVDLDVVSGGGYLYIDADAGSYAGVLELGLLEVGVSAVAIIDTALPDIDGWSMFFALFLDLPSIQLGFGFTLTGVGGVAGINRAIDVDALGSAVRSGSLDSVLFPADPIAEAPLIIETFQAIFPPADGSYVFGPIVRIGWGTPTLIEAQLGIVIQLPDPFVIVVLGSITAILPEPDVALIELHLDVAGVIDVTAGTLAIDASLHDSHIAGFALSGDMALRADFADAQQFLLSVGGFHPRFEAPCDFPDLRPVTFGIHAGSVLRIDFMSYFAITSNSVQCGADFTLDAEVMGFGVFGSCGFDALVEFSPFRILTSVHFEVSITAVGVDLMGVTLHASVEGPNRWHVIGTAHFEVLGIGKDIRVDELIGPKQSEPPVPAADVLVDLVAALEADDAWQVTEVAEHAVTFRPIDDPTDPLYAERYANPDSLIELRQTVVPLGIAIEQYGNAPVGDHALFELAPVGLASSGTLEDWFAPGRFFAMSNDDKLEGPEFQRMRSGLCFGTDQPTAGTDVSVDVGYAAYVIDPEFEEDVPLNQAVRNDAVAGVILATTSTTTYSVTQNYDVAMVASATAASGSPAFRVVDRHGTTVGAATSWAAARSRRGADRSLHIERTAVGA
jgi:hypothetical protein